MLNFLSLADPADLLGFQQNSRISNANNAIKKAQEKADAASVANKDLYNQFYNKTQSTYGDTAAKVDDYLKNLEGTEAYDPGKFVYTGDKKYEGLVMDVWDSKKDNDGNIIGYYDLIEYSSEGIIKLGVPENIKILDNGMIDDRWWKFNDDKQEGDGQSEAD